MSITDGYIDDLIIRRQISPSRVVTDNGGEFDESPAFEMMHELFASAPPFPSSHQVCRYPASPRVRRRDDDESDSDSGSESGISYSMWESEVDSDECDYTEYTSDESEDDGPPDLQDLSDYESEHDEVYESEEESSIPDLICEDELSEEMRLAINSISVPATYGFSEQRQLVAPPVHDGAITVSHTVYEDDEVIVYFSGIRVVNEVDQNSSSIEWFRAIGEGSAIPHPPRGFSLVKISSRTIERPLRTAEDNRCITMMVKIGKMDAYTMFDTGSTSDSLSPDFTRVAGMKVFTLVKPLNGQLGTVGSGSKINFGTSARIQFASVDEEYYFDVFNIDRYDCILGTPSMRRFGIMPDLVNNAVIIGGISYPALTSDEDTIEQSRRSASRVVTAPPGADVRRQ